MVKIAYLDLWAERYGNPIRLEDITDITKWKEADKIMSRDLVEIPNGVGLLHVEELKKYINVELVSNPSEADVLITSCFGNRKAQYKDKKMIILGFEKECAEMDYHMFERALYITSFYFNNSLCRYYNLPLFYLYNGFSLNEKLFKKRKLNKKTNFCLSIISNTSAVKRCEYVKKIMEYKKIDNYGMFDKNNSDKLIERTTWYDPRLIDKIRPYKFMIAMENGSVLNYNTEKILNAWLGGAIPIYYGDPNIDKVYNEKAFINVNKLGIEKAIEKIKELDENEELYKEMFEETILTKECKNIKNLDEDRFRKTIKDFMLRSVK
jgi:hypothetical protein